MNDNNLNYNEMEALHDDLADAIYAREGVIIDLVLTRKILQIVRKHDCPPLATDPNPPPVVKK